MKRFVRGMSAALLLALACAAAGAQEFDDDEGWVRYSSLCVAFPFYSWDYDVDLDYDFLNYDIVPASFESNGYTFDYQAHHVSPTIGFAVLFRCGFGGWRGDYKASYGFLEGTYDEPEDVNLTYSYKDLKGFMTYFKVGLGKAFELLDDRLAIIPTAGVGLDLYALAKTEDAYEEYDEGEKVSLHYAAFDGVIDIFLNVMASYMFTEHFGLTASCEMSFPVFGVGYYRTGDGTVTKDGATTLDGFSSVNFMPAVGICLRF